MNTLLQKLYHLSTGFIEKCVLILFFILAITSFLFSVYYENSETKILIFHINPFLLYFLAGAFYIFLLHRTTAYILNNPQKRIPRFLAIISILILFFTLFWTAFTKTIPTADQATVFNLAKSFYHDYYAAVTNKDSYLAVYPHQIGLVFYYEILLRLLHTEDFRILQGMNAIYIVLCTLSQYRILTHFFEDRKIPLYYMGLAVFCLPLFFFTPFVYGEIPSFAFLLFGTLLFLESQKQSKLWIRLSLLFLSIISFAIMTAVRKNSLIFVIAFCIILFLFILRTKKIQLIPYLLIVFLACISILPAIQSYYETKNQSQIGSGAPSISFVTMGLQESEYGPGWYNNYNFYTFVDVADYDSELAASIAKADLIDELEYYAQHPITALKFFAKKFVYEWNNTGYASIYSNHTPYGTRFAFLQSFFTGSMYNVSMYFMAFYQFFIYFMIFLGLYSFNRLDKKKKSIFVLLFPLTTLGGCLFYLAWEGNGRYVFPYFYLSLPLAAYGVHYFIATLFPHIKALVLRHTSLRKESD